MTAYYTNYFLVASSLRKKFYLSQYFIKFQKSNFLFISHMLNKSVVPIKYNISANELFSHFQLSSVLQIIQQWTNGAKE